MSSGLRHDCLHQGRSQQPTCMMCTARALLAASVHPGSGAPGCCARGGKLRRLLLGPGSTKKTCMPSPRPQLMLSAANRLFTTPASASLLLRLPAYLMGLLSCSRRWLPVSRMSSAKTLWACCTADSVQQGAYVSRSHPRSEIRGSAVETFDSTNNTAVALTEASAFTRVQRIWYVDSLCKQE